MSETLRCGMKVPTPRVTVQQFGFSWVVLVDGIQADDGEHTTKREANAQAKRVREGLRDDG